MAGPAMPMLADLSAMMTSQQPRKAALPAKQRPETMPTTGTLPLSSAKAANDGWYSPDTEGKSTSPGRPPPPSPNSTSGSSSRSATSTMRSVLIWLRLPCVPAITVAS
ncbi:hypothetical protein D3C81_1623280 [compost metagenome]